jgi:lipopolysaccharide transport system permease protein
MAQLIIEAGRAEGQYWRDLWRFRELFYVLAWRDIMVRYKQTAIGVLWAILKPLLSTVVLVLIFGHLAHMSSAGNAPYALMVFAAMMPWQFFSDSLSGASQSVVGNASLISKVYFPRLIIPAAAVVTALVDFAISFAILLAMMAWFEFWPTWRLLLLPGFILLAFFAALGPGLFLTALNVQFRDFRFVIPFILQLGTFISPVGYPSSTVHEKWRLLYSLNPMVGVIDGFRWAILGEESQIYLPGFLLSLIITAMLMWLGIWYFRRMERSFADVI